MTEQESPLEHIVQHPLIERTTSVGPLTPDGKITVFSDQIAMIALAGLLLIALVPPNRPGWAPRAPVWRSIAGGRPETTLLLIMDRPEAPGTAIAILKGRHDTARPSSIHGSGRR